MIMSYTAGGRSRYFFLYRADDDDQDDINWMMPHTCTAGGRGRKCFRIESSSFHRRDRLCTSGIAVPCFSRTSSGGP